jgi:phytoene synthase
MQLTNILRDIKEDLDRNRIYLPQEELRRFNVGLEQLQSEKIDANFIALMKYQISRARQYYKNSEKGFSLITCPHCRFVARAMKEMYCGILDNIEQNNYDVFRHRAYVSLAKKIILLPKILLKKAY